ncbi:hypothetical protein [Francisella tularensis]|uniref:hypothetical protein n=1 Tax=Francisella tularensis TaxID=263 RepID=UPI0008F492B9|nr:hypothetical protein [Francisella tularensis]APA83244.1 hypothetical protein N894_1260 [Francisella tularensis subsp. novicida PA10-7858]
MSNNEDFFGIEVGLDTTKAEKDLNSFKNKLKDNQNITFNIDFGNLKSFLEEVFGKKIVKKFGENYKKELEQQTASIKSENISKDKEKEEFKKLSAIEKISMYKDDVKKKKIDDYLTQDQKDALFEKRKYLRQKNADNALDFIKKDKEKEQQKKDGTYKGLADQIADKMGGTMKDNFVKPIIGGLAGMISALSLDKILNTITSSANNITELSNSVWGKNISAAQAKGFRQDFGELGYDEKNADNLINMINEAQTGKGTALSSYLAQKVGGNYREMNISNIIQRLGTKLADEWNNSGFNGKGNMQDLAKNHGLDIDNFRTIIQLANKGKLSDDYREYKAKSTKLDNNAVDSATKIAHIQSIISNSLENAKTDLMYGDRKSMERYMPNAGGVEFAKLIMDWFSGDKKQSQSTSTNNTSSTTSNITVQNMTVKANDAKEFAKSVTKKLYDFSIGLDDYTSNISRVG